MATGASSSGRRVATPPLCWTIALTNAGCCQRWLRLLAPPQNGRGAYRVYPPQSVARIRFIKRAQQLGFTLQEIADWLSVKAGQTVTLQGVDAVWTRRGPLLTLTAALQQLSRQPPVAVLAQPGSLTEIVHARAVLDSALPVIEARTANVRRELASLRRLQDQAQLALKALTTSRATLAGRRTELTRLENERRIRARDLRGSARLEADRALGFGEQARDLSELIVRLEGDAATRERLATLAGALPRPANPLRPRPLPVDTAAASRGTAPAYRLPAVGPLLVGLGEVSSSGARSRGLTIAARPGGQIVAPADGRVVFAGDYRGYDKIVILDHGDGWTSLVTGMIGLSTSVGDVVDAGSPLGRAGANRPRITVELRRSGQPVDIAALVV